MKTYRSFVRNVELKKLRNYDHVTFVIFIALDQLTKAALRYGEVQ